MLSLIKDLPQYVFKPTWVLGNCSATCLLGTLKADIILFQFRPDFFGSTLGGVNKMAVIVHDDMPIDQALKMLWREANRENIPAELLKNRYRIKETATRHEFKKYWTKNKKRRRAAKRKLAKKGKV